jgi:hypothetical protein
VRVGLLELVGGAVDDELEQLRARALALEESDGASSSASMARSAMSISSGGTLPSGAPSASISPASKRASRRARNASSDGCHSHSSATPSRPR